MTEPDPKPKTFATSLSCMIKTRPHSITWLTCMMNATSTGLYWSMDFHPTQLYAIRLLGKQCCTHLKALDFSTGPGGDNGSRSSGQGPSSKENWTTKHFHSTKLNTECNRTTDKGIRLTSQEWCRHTIICNGRNHATHNGYQTKPIKELKDLMQAINQWVERARTATSHQGWKKGATPI